MARPPLQRRLYVDRAVLGCVMRTSRGIPVWPAGELDDVVTLRRTAALFGADLIECNSRRAAPPSMSGEESVEAIGDEAIEPARLYAHLTRRRLRVARAGGGRIDHHTSVVVMIASRIDASFLEELYADRTRPSALGMICAESETALRRQVLIRSAAAVLGGPVERPRVDIYPQLAAGHLTASRWEIFGRDAEPQVLRDALSASAGVLTIGTHGDGLDAYLNDHLILCTLRQSAPAGSDAASPRCHETAFCHRRNVPVSEATLSGALLSPDQLSARLLLFDVCYGILPAGSVVDPLWSLGVKLAANPAVGALITSWQTTIGSPIEARALAAMLASGMPAGVAVQCYLRARPGRNLCLFGDPRVRLPRSSALPIPRPARVSAKEETPKIDGDDATFVRIVLERLEARSPEALRADVVRAAAAARDLEGNLHAACATEFRDAFLRFIVRRGWADWLEDWMPFAKLSPVAARRACWGCGGVVRSHLADTVVRGARPRRISTCSVCAVIEDVPNDVMCALEQTSGTFRLAGHIPRGVWSGRLMLWSANREDVASWEWPSDEAGAPARAFTPDRWPRGPLRISLAMVHGRSPLLVNRMGRAPR